ncbi:MAG: FMN phosphatase YigB (HAD superfamily) [bacterium]|jgi:FMN phosphatase YigB (HAD superfamily)
MQSLFDLELQIFDLDDTLINTRWAYTQAQQSALKSVYSQLNLDIPIQKFQQQIQWFCKQYSSGNPELYFSAFLTNISIKDSLQKKILEQLLLTYHQDYWKNLQPLPNASAILAKLEKQGKKLALVSNGLPTNQHRKLAHTKLDQFFSFEVRYISGDFATSQKKPSSYMIEKACHFYQVIPNNAVYYGNVIGDILAGNLAGTKTVFYGKKEVFQDLPKLAQPDFIISDWEI